MYNVNSTYDCWLNYDNCKELKTKESYKKYCNIIYFKESDDVINSGVKELKLAINKIFNINVHITNELPKEPHIFLGILNNKELKKKDLK